MLGVSIVLLCCRCVYGVAGAAGCHAAQRAKEGGCHGQYTRERTSHTWHWYCRPLENPFKQSHSLTRSQ